MLCGLWGLVAAVIFHGFVLWLKLYERFAICRFDGFKAFRCWCRAAPRPMVSSDLRFRTECTLNPEDLFVEVIGSPARDKTFFEVLSTRVMGCQASFGLRAYGLLLTFLFGCWELRGRG